MKPPTDSRRCPPGDAGIAMVLSLLFMLVLSALGTTMLVLSRSETLSSVSYRMMSQARFGAESGVHKAAHFLVNTAGSTSLYSLPGAASLSNFDMTQSPVRYNGQAVVLSSLSGVSQNYPDAAIKTAFAAASQGTLPVGDATVVYTSSATLLSMREVLVYGAVSSTVVQTWRLTARGQIQGARQAEVEVSAIIERQIVPATTYGMFATNNGCGALTVSGGVQTDSYDSTSMTLVSGLPATDPWGGNVGTNGNMTESGTSTVVKGSLSTPRAGVGNCKTGAITALDQSGNAQVTGGVMKLSQEVTYPLPAPPAPMPPTTTTIFNGSGATCTVPAMVALLAASASGGGGGTCAMISGVATLTPPSGGVMLLGNIRLNGGAQLAFTAGNYNINSIKLSGNSTVKISTGQVVFNIAGVSDTTPVDFSGGVVTNPSFMSHDFRILYAGTGGVKLTGGTTTAATVYAPKASIDISGGAHFFGAAIGAAINMSGGVKFHYDRWLEQEFFTLGPQMMSVFTWKQY